LRATLVLAGMIAERPNPVNDTPGQAKMAPHAIWARKPPIAGHLRGVVRERATSLPTIAGDRPMAENPCAAGARPPPTGGKCALALSLALHELATNATKYGALSVAEGRVRLAWHTADGLLRLSWHESGGPPVAPPTRRGLGSRMLNDGLFRDLNGETRLDYAVDGVRHEISAPL
jgi:hypothetical protein